jgi:hypothetical protein
VIRKIVPVMECRSSVRGFVFIIILILRYYQICNINIDDMWTIH